MNELAFTIHILFPVIIGMCIWQRKKTQAFARTDSVQGKHWNVAFANGNIKNTL